MDCFAHKQSSSAKLNGSTLLAEKWDLFAFFNAGQKLGFVLYANPPFFSKNAQRANLKERFSLPTLIDRRANVGLVFCSLLVFYRTSDVDGRRNEKGKTCFHPANPFIAFYPSDVCVAKKYPFLYGGPSPQGRNKETVTQIKREGKKEK